MKQTHALAPDALKQLFTEARTHHVWSKESLSEDTLKSIYDLAKWGPTAINANPMRILFVQTDEAKEKLYPALMGSNVEQVRQAPAVAIIAYDEKFFDQLPTLFPAYDARPMFVSDKAAADVFAMRNSSLQGAYFMMAVRALGLDVGPMSGFNNQKVDETFFAGSSWKSNFICAIGHGEDSKLFPRGPRLDFGEAAKII